MSTFTNNPKASTSFSNRANASGVTLVGDMSENDFILLLGSAPTFSTMIPGVVGGDKAFGDLTFEDLIFLPARLWSQLSKNASAWLNTAPNSSHTMPGFK